MGFLPQNDNKIKTVLDNAVDVAYTLCCQLGLTAIRKGRAAIRIVSDLGIVLKKGTMYKTRI